LFDLDVQSTIDEKEGKLIQISNKLCLNSDDSTDDSTDDSISIQDNPTIQSYSEVRTSEDENNGVNLTIDN
jgi:hypothetical protein